MPCAFPEKNLIPSDYVEIDGLQVIYQYLYAARLEMRRADNRSFETNVSGLEIKNVVGANIKGLTRVEDGDALVFEANRSSPIAFAYKAGQLRMAGTRYEFYPEQIKRLTGGTSADGEASDYIPSPGIPQLAENR